MKKLTFLLTCIMALTIIVSGCNVLDNETFSADKDITVVSREDGSGTRGAFIELTGIEEKDANGNKVDNTVSSAIITNSTAGVITTVASNPYAIGYISLGSLNDTVKALSIEGTLPSVETVKNGTYKISRPFNIATKSSLSPTAADFINYIASAEGQAIVENNGYVSVTDNAAGYQSGNLSGKIVVAGSSSVTPLMEKLKEGYVALNPNIDIEIQQSDSTTGMSQAAEGTCDIGMASRELKDSEKEKGLTSQVIALDGIAVVVNNNNTATDLTVDQLKAIFTGETTIWSEVL